jgi:two-component system NarL family sensor kinase
VTNAARHSQGTELRVGLKCDSGYLRLTIADNGKGFEEEAVGRHPTDSRPGRHGNGLRNMRDRLTSVNGTFAITSDPGQGTTVTISVPLSKM